MLVVGEAMYIQEQEEYGKSLYPLLNIVTHPFPKPTPGKPDTNQGGREKQSFLIISIWVGPLGCRKESLLKRKTRSRQRWGPAEAPPWSFQPVTWVITGMDTP